MNIFKSYFVHPIDNWTQATDYSGQYELHPRVPRLLPCQNKFVKRKKQLPCKRLETSKENKNYHIWVTSLSLHIGEKKCYFFGEFEPLLL